MTASAAAGSAAAGGAAAPVLLLVRPPRPLPATPLAAVGWGLTEAGSHPTSARLRVRAGGAAASPYPAALCSGPKRAGGGGVGPRGGSEPGQAAFVAAVSRSVGPTDRRAARPELVVSGLRRQTKDPCSAVHSGCGRDTAPPPSPCFRRSPYVTSESKMAIAQLCCFAKSLRYSVAQRCSGVRLCFTLLGSKPASAALSVLQFLCVHSGPPTREKQNHSL